MTPAAYVHFYQNMIGADVFGFWYTHILMAFKLFLENNFLLPGMNACVLLQHSNSDVIPARSHIFGA